MKKDREEEILHHVAKMFRHVGDCKITNDHTKKQKTYIFSINAFDNEIIMSDSLFVDINNEMEKLGYDLLAIKLDYKTLQVIYRHTKEEN